MNDLDKGLAAYKRRDYEAALRELLPLAEQGQMDAEFHIALMYYYGWGVTSEMAEAAKWYRHPAEQGNASAQFYLGDMYANGYGVPQSYAEAAQWFRRAAEQGEPNAQNSLGDMYRQGLEVLQDLAEAMNWYCKAAEQGLSAPLAALGDMYRDGHGVPQDYVQAHKWYNLASARHGLDWTDTQRKRDKLAEQMMPAQVAAAQRLARKWWEAFEKRGRKE